MKLLTVRHCELQLDRALGIWRAGFGCCEKAVEINTTTVRKLLAQIDVNSESLVRGGVAGFVSASGNLAVTHWTSAFACGLDLQRQFQAIITRK